MNEHNEERTTFAAFLEETDPSLAEWARRATSTDDLRMATAYGELYALYEMGRIADRYAEDDPHFMTVAEQWAAGYLALARRRNSARFPHLLEAARAESEATGEWRQHVIAEGERQIAESEAIERAALLDIAFAEPAEDDPFLNNLNKDPADESGGDDEHDAV